MQIAFSVNSSIHFICTWYIYSSAECSFSFRGITWWSSNFSFKASHPVVKSNKMIFYFIVLFQSIQRKLFFEVLDYSILCHYSNLPLQKKLLKMLVTIFEIRQLSHEFTGSVTVIEHLSETATVGVLYERCSWKFRKIHKTPTTLLKKDSDKDTFPVNFANI